MEIRTIFRLFAISNLLFVVGADYDRKNVIKSMVDNNEVEEYLSMSESVSENGKSQLSLDNLRPGSKNNPTLLQPDDESDNEIKTPEKTDPLDEGNRKILTFGKRVFQSIERHGLMTKDLSLLNSGKSHIDWWKQNRRLEAMRKRLAEELEKNLELKLRLQSLGWRNNSAQIPHQRIINIDRSDIKKPTRPQKGVVKFCILYKIFIIDSDTGEPDTDSPTKFTLNTRDPSDFGATTSDFGVIDVISGVKPTSNEDEGSTSNLNYLGEEVVDGDRFLQLIPLVVEELRQGLMSDEERRVFRRIFGKRLWQLLDREASKRLDQPMDYDLAKFLFKGELPERESENVRGHHKQNGLAHKKRKNRMHVQRKNQQRDNDYENKYYDDYTSRIMV